MTGAFGINDKPSRRTRGCETRETDEIVKKAIAANQKLMASGNKSMDLKGYRGNLFKQTLGADWNSQPRANIAADAQ